MSTPRASALKIVPMCRSCRMLTPCRARRRPGAALARVPLHKSRWRTRAQLTPEPRCLYRRKYLESISTECQNTPRSGRLWTRLDEGTRTRCRPKNAPAVVRRRGRSRQSRRQDTKPSYRATGSAAEEVRIDAAQPRWLITQAKSLTRTRCITNTDTRPHGDAEL